MRKNIVHVGADQLSYEIRGITEYAKKIENLGVNIYWENIGDPVIKGEKIPFWIKDMIKILLETDMNWAYSPTKGLDITREYLAKKANNVNGNLNLNPEDIIFFNGLGDAISKIYSLLDKDVRVIGPSPAYPTHSSAEGAHSGYEQLTYKLDENNNWLVDLEDLRNKVMYNDMIVGILIINPDNPTGMVYPREVLQEIVNIAKQYDLFLISDEIYANLVYEGEKFISLSEVIDNQVPTIIMKGISKDLPWPGSRCGWIEVYNRIKDENFKKFVKSIVDSKMLEVCSTTLPQAAIPRIFECNDFENYLVERKQELKKKANYVYECLKDVDGLIVNKTYGAFYTSIVFKKGVLNQNQKFNIKDDKIRTLVEKEVKNVKDDQRFVYYLLAKTGICVVPLTSFCTDLNGFRITLLEKDFDKFKHIFDTLKENIIEYLNS